MIKLYDSNEKLFNNNGLKILKPYKCILYKEDNGDYYIEIEDTVNNLDYYQANMIIKCPTPFPEGEQCFRIGGQPEKSTSKIKIKAKHIYFDRANYIIDDRNIVDKDCNYALDHLNTNADIESPFTTSSDITSINSYRCVRKSLQEADNVLIERWGGHLVRDNFKVAINKTIGTDRGVTLKYAKNITNINATENWDDVITKILPVGKDGVLLPEKYIELEEKLYDIPFTKVVSFSQDLEKLDTETDEQFKNRLITDLRKQAVEYLNNNKLPKVNYTLSAHLEEITDVGDTIYVEHPKLNISLTTNVISIKYDVILNKYKSIEFGNFKNSLKNLIKDVNKNTEQLVESMSNDTKAFLEEELKNAAATMWEALGNSYVIYDGDKILVLDSLPKENAKDVILINSKGIAFGHEGINGNFTSAWTIDGTLDMQNINVVNLVADMIKGGTLKLGGKGNTNGVIAVYDTDGNVIATIDNQGINFVIEQRQTNLKEIIDSIDLFSTDLDIYNLTIPCKGYIPLETKDFFINHYSYFKGKQVFVTPTLKEQIEGLTIELTENDIKVSTDSSIAISNISNELILTFEYSDGTSKYSLQKKVIITLVQKGEDGAKGEKGEDGAPGRDGAPGKDGAPGVQGPPGENGQSTYFYVKYSVNENGNPMLDAPTADTKYIGVATTTAETPPTTYTAYTWSLIKGADGKDGINGKDGTNGTPGTPGADGRTPYLHIMYSEDGETFTPEDENYALGKKPSDYRGEYVDYTEEDSTNFEDYEWYYLNRNVDDKISDLQSQINTNDTNANNNYQDMLGRLNNYADKESVNTLIQKVEVIQSSTDYTIEVIKDIQQNGVDRVTTQNSFTFNEYGLNIDENGAPVSNTQNSYGMTIKDKNKNEDLLFAGYDKETNETVVKTNKMTVGKSLDIPRSRFEAYDSPRFGKSTGAYS